MSQLADMDAAARDALAGRLAERYAAFQAQNLALDMTRGKPCAAQLDLANDLLSAVDGTSWTSEDGTDTRNYGGLGGLPAARALCADFLEVGPGEVVVHNNASLSLMHDVVAWALLKGVPGGAAPWRDGPAKFLCPAPGYDRHFSICEHFGIEMITVDMGADGPDMDTVERLVAQDAAIKGIWCVPKYSNPTGVTFSDAVVDRLAGMSAAAPDFRIFWDNAYTVHHLTETPDRLKNVLAACRAAGHEDRVLLFGSTSKVSFAGAGLGMVGGSATNVKWVLANMGMQAICGDKINQLRHVRFFGDMDGIAAHMRKHAAIIKPKFDAVLEILERELGPHGVADWSRPNGGYFISLDGPDGTAKAVVKMAADAGVKLTSAGATFPYGNDPRDRNIRIAPTLPSLAEIRQATELLAICMLRCALQAQG